MVISPLSSTSWQTTALEWIVNLSRLGRTKVSYIPLKGLKSKQQHIGGIASSHESSGRSSERGHAPHIDGYSLVMLVKSFRILALASELKFLLPLALLSLSVMSSSLWTIGLGTLSICKSVFNGSTLDIERV